VARGEWKTEFRPSVPGSSMARRRIVYRESPFTIAREHGVSWRYEGREVNFYDAEGRRCDEYGRVIEEPKRPCDWCGEAFPIRDPRRRYCSARCRKEAWKARRRG
jgi:hypothetical protein